MDEILLLKKQIRRLKKKRSRFVHKRRQILSLCRPPIVIPPLLRRYPLDAEEKLQWASISAVKLDGQKVDLTLLEDKKMLNDVIINTYSDMLLTDELFIHSTFFHEKLTQGGQYSFENASFWQKNYRDFRAILFPLNVNKNHWILCCADTRTKILLVYDSLNDATPESYKGVIQDILRYLNDLTLTKWKLRVADCAKQTNGYDCGVFCCVFINALISWYAHNEFYLPMKFPISDTDIYNQRRQIKLDFLS